MTDCELARFTLDEPASVVPRTLLLAYQATMRCVASWGSEALGAAGHLAHAETEMALRYAAAGRSFR